MTKIEEKMNSLEKIYTFLISQDFPQWLLLIMLSGFIIDFTYTSQVLYNDKAYFLAHESNSFLKFSFLNNLWYLYSLFAILLYSTQFVVVKMTYNLVIRSVSLVLGVAQIGTPLAWIFGWEIFAVFYLSVLSIIFYSVYLFIPKKEKRRHNNMAP